MGVLIGCLKAEFIKHRRSAVVSAHIVLPVLCAVVVAGYDRVSGWDIPTKISAYLEVLAAAVPFLIGIITGQALQMEHRAGRYQLLLGTIPSRSASFLGKLLFLLACFFCASALALGLFAVLYPVLPLWLFAKPWSLLSFTALPLYVLHLFVGMRFGKGATMGLGIAGSLFAALMATGLGDGIWKAVPWAWGIRAMDAAVLSWYDPQRGLHAYGELVIGMVVCAGASACLLGACLLWFRRWEGGKSAE